MSNILLPILTPWEDNLGGLGMPSLQFGWVHAQTIYQNGAQVAVLASPIFTGIPAGPTASPGTNTTQLATTAFVTAATGGEVNLAQLLAATTDKVFLGRNTAGAGDFEEVTATQLFDWIGTPAQGDILYRGASAWAGLARPSGTASFLKHLGTASNPLWAEYLAENDVDFTALLDATVDKRLIGAATAGAFGELEISTVLDWLGTAAQGDLLVRGAAGWELVPRPGSPGAYYFGHDGTAANGAWSAYSSTAPTTGNIWPIVSPFFTASSSIGWDVATSNQAKARILVATNGGLVGDASAAAALDYDNLTAEATIAGSDLVAFWDESAAAGAGAIRSCTVDQIAGAVGGPPFGDSASLIQNSTDATKFAKLSAALITTGTTRTYSFPDKSMTFADDADVLYNDGTIAGTGRQQFEGLKFGAATTLTVATGIITVVDKGWYQVAGEGAVDDDLDTINGLTAGEWCFLQAADGAQTITFKHGVDNLSAIGNADVALNDLHDLLIAFHNGVDITIAPFGGAAGSGDALVANPLSQFAATTSAQLAGVISDETGTGALVFANSPTLVTPALGTPSSGDLAGCTNLPASGVELASIGAATYTTLQQIQDVVHSSGWAAGGAVTNGGGGTVDVAAGSGLIRATDSEVAQLLMFDWSASAGLALTDASVNYVYIDYNAGSPGAAASTTDPTGDHTKVLLAKVYRDGTSVYIFEGVRATIGDHAGLMMRGMAETMPFAHVSGAMTTEAGTRQLQISAGVFWHGLTRITTSAIDTTVAGTFSYWYRDGGGGWTEVASQTTIDNTKYDNNSGTLATLTNNRYGVHWLYLSDQGALHVVYGRGDYTLVDAQDVTSAPTPPPMVGVNSRLISKIIIQESASVFTSIESAFMSTFAAAPIIGLIDLTSDVTGVLPAANGGTGISTLGTGVATALGINIGSAGAPVTNGGALGTPSSGALGSCTAYEASALASTGEAGGTKFLREDGDGTCSFQTITGGGDALVANPLSQFAATTSAQLAGVISDETGTGSLVFANSPTLVTPALGTPSSLNLTYATGLPLTTGVTGVLPIANMATGTPTGSKFVRDDGTLATPGSGGTLDGYTDGIRINDATTPLSVSSTYSPIGTANQFSAVSYNYDGFSVLSLANADPTSNRILGFIHGSHTTGQTPLIYVSGFVDNIDTSYLSANANVYIAASGAVNGTANGNPVGVCITSDATTGSIYFFGPRDVPSAAAIGLGTTNSPEFTGVNVGHATDTTITRAAAGVLAVEGVRVASVVRYEDWSVPAGAWTPADTDGAEPGVVVYSGNDIDTLAFDATTEEACYYTFRLPKNYGGGVIYWSVDWDAVATASGDVVWGLSGGAYTNSDALTTALGTERTATDTLITVGDVHQITDATGVTLAGTPAAGEFCVLKLVAKTSGTIAVDVLLLNVQLQYQTATTAPTVFS